MSDSLTVQTVLFKYNRGSAVVTVGTGNEATVDECHRFHYKMGEKTHPSGDRLYLWEFDHKGPWQHEDEARRKATDELNARVYYVLQAEPSWFSGWDR